MNILTSAKKFKNFHADDFKGCVISKILSNVAENKRLYLWFRKLMKWKNFAKQTQLQVESKVTPCFLINGQTDLST